MTQMESLVARGALGLIGALITPYVGRLSFAEQTTSPISNRAMLGLFALSRLAFYLLVFVLLRIAPRGDIPGVYYPFALNVLAGLVPYRDFLCWYAPLHSYIDAIAVFFWRSPAAIILVAIFAEIVMLVIWSSIAKSNLSQRAFRAALLLYLISPISVLVVTIDGKNDVMIGMFLALSVWLALKDRPFISGMACALSVCCVKFLAFFYLSIYVLSLRRWRRWLIGSICVIVVVYGGFFAVLRAPVVQPLHELAKPKYNTSGNLPFLFESLVGFRVNIGVWHALEMACLFAVLVKILVSARVYRTGTDKLPIRDRFQLHTFMYGSVAVTMTLLILSNKSWMTYSLITFFLTCFLIVESKPVFTWLFAVFQFVAILEPSFWASIMNFSDSLQLHALVLSRQPVAEVFLGLQFLELAGYVIFFVLAMQQLSRKSLGREDSRRSAPQERVSGASV